MNNELFQHARSAYVVKDYETALNQFTECLQDRMNILEPGEMGMLYHQIGNCLVKLQDPEEAIHAYSQAVLDASYDAIGTVYYNLGMVYAGHSDFEDAIENFTKAIDDPRYPTPFKANIAMGNSLMKLGRSAEAGAAFRAAALDENNPNPTSALLNLGVCFMALNRPMDAVASYESALQFDMDDTTRNKLFANMGQAYVAAGKMSKAIKAFETALADKTYVFNDAANVDYQRAVASVAAGVGDEPDEVYSDADLSGLDVSSDGVPYNDISEQATTVMAPVSSAQQQQADEFFSYDNQFEDWGESSKKKHGCGIKILVFILILLIALVGGGAFCVTQGIGYPSKQTVVTNLFTNPSDTSVYSSDMDQTKISQIKDSITVDADPTFQGESNGLTSAKVYVTATASGGAEVPYQVTLVRDGIGWKVSGVTLNFTSQQN